MTKEKVKTILGLLYVGFVINPLIYLQYIAYELMKEEEN